MVIQVCSDKKNREQVGGVDTLFTAAAKFGGVGVGWRGVGFSTISEGR